jgi:hypothetical protein
LIAIVLLSLLAQWSWIYLVLKSPVRAAKISKHQTLDKILTLLIIVLTVLIINDLIALGLMSQFGESVYKRTMEILLTSYSSIILLAFLVLYFAFIVLIRSDESFVFLRC